MSAVRRRSALLGSCAWLALAAGAAHADTEAIKVTTVGTGPGPTGFNYYQPPGGYSFTWDFTANSAIDVTQLGYYDSALTGQANPDGFGSHLVTLTDLTTDTTLASATVTSASPVTGDFNYAPIAPVALNTADTYRVSGDMTTQYYLVDLNRSAAPAAAQINYAFVVGNIFGSPSPSGTYSDFGPNFQFAATAAACTENVAGRDIIALSGDKCIAAPGAYNPTTTGVGGLPVTYNGFGFFANGGGSIDSPGDVTITTSDPNGTGGSSAVWSRGSGPAITLEGSTTIATTGAGSPGLYATGGGLISASGALDATTSGDGASAANASGAGSKISLSGGGALAASGANAIVVQADGGGLVTIDGGEAQTNVTASGQARIGLYAAGLGSEIDATNVAVSTASDVGAAVLADNHAAITMNGGSVATSGRFAADVTAQNFGAVTLNGTQLTATGDGGVTLYATTGGRIDASNVSITSSGGIDSVTGAGPGGAVNAGSRGASGATGGILNISNASISLTGTSNGTGVFTADGGVTTLTNDTVTLGAGTGVASFAGGRTTIFGGAIHTTGASGLGLRASGLSGQGSGGSPGQIASQLYNGAGLAITTSGAGAYGVEADGGGRVSLAGGSVTTSGPGASGLYATGANSIVGALNVAVAASGAGAQAALAEGGGLLALSSGSASTDGADSTVIVVDGGASAQATGTTITATGAGSGGVSVSGATSSFSGVGLTIRIQGGYDAGSGGQHGGVGAGASTPIGVATSLGFDAASSPHAGGGGGFSADGAKADLTNTSIAMSGDGALGVYNAYGGSLTMTGGGIATSGLSSNAVFAEAGGKTLLSNLTISTTGAGSRGLDALGPATVLTGSQLTISTSGGRDASGNAANGLFNSAGAVTLLTSSIATGGDYASGALTRNGGATTISNSAISTSGLQADALYAAGGSVINLKSVQLTTTGEAAKGLDVEGTGTSLTGSGLTISTSGGLDPATGFRAQGVYNGAAATPGTGTTGGGVAMLDHTSVTTRGDGAFGVDTGAGGSTQFDGGAITTYGAGAVALIAADAGTLASAGADGEGVALAITTSGASAFGAYAQGGAKIVLTGATIATSGDGGIGLAVAGAGSLLQATNVSVSVKGGLDAATGFQAFGAYNGPGANATSGGVLSLAQVTLATSGAGASGVVTGAGGVTTMLGGSVATSGEAALGVLASGGGSASLNAIGVTTSGEAAHAVVASGAGSTVALSGANTLTTTGNGAAGIFARSGGVVTATDPVSISTAGTNALSTGLSSFGVAADGQNSAVTLGAATLVTSGAGAVGLYASDANATGAGGAIVVNGALSVTTQSSFAYDAFASGKGSEIKLNGASTLNVGTGAFGLYATGGGAIAVTGPLTINAGLAGFGGGAEADSGSSITLGGTSSIKLTASNLAGLFATGTGVVSTTAALSVDAGANYGLIAQGGAIHLGAATVVTTSGAAGVYAVNGGVVSATGGLSVTTSGAGSIALRATGANSTISADFVNISSANAGGPAVLAETGGGMRLGGGAISTTQNGMVNVMAGAGSTVTLSDISLSTSGLASETLWTNGGTIAGSNVTIQSSSDNDPATGNNGGGAVNLAGAMQLSDSHLHMTGVEDFGVYVGQGGQTTLTGGEIDTSNGAGAIVRDPGSRLSATGVDISAGGASEPGVTVSGGASLSFQGGSIATSGDGAHGLLVSGAGSTAALSGAVGITVAGAGAAGVMADAGGAVTASGPLTVKAASFGIYVNGASSISLSGPLSLTTTAATGAAIALNGDHASFSGAGGGTIDAAGTAIAFLNGASQSADFTGYSIASAGDLVFADPASSTLNFTDTTANAGTGNLADVTNGSQLTFNASNSALTGGFATAMGSVSNVNLTNGSTWTITGPATVTNLSVSNSSASFAPGGGFKTLTTTNYVGSGATLTFNAALGGTHPGSDQLVINGGRATGTTTILVNAVGTGGATPVTLVTTANGGSLAPGAFTLAGPLVVDGTAYSLQGQTDAAVLVPGMTTTQTSGSLATLAQSRQSQAITGRVLSSILTGATEQINCSSCSSGFASFGSFALGVHGRWSLSPSVALLAGLSYDSYSGRGVTVNGSLIGAMALRYDPAQLGRYRPFVEAGLATQPYASVTFRRSYTISPALGGSGVGVGNTLSRSAATYGRVGYIWRLSRTDEAAAYTDLTRSWQWTGGYVESATPGNPFGAQVAPSLDTMNVWRVGGQFTHLFGEHVEADISLGYARAFAAKYGSSAVVPGFDGIATGSAPSSFDWGEWGGRISYRFSKTVIGDAFVLGTVGAQPAGTQIHGGVALRMAF